MYSYSSEGAYYTTLTNGKKIDNILDEMLINETDSIAKTKIENWYSNKLLSYTDYIEDTVYCNDRSISTIGGWDPNGGDNRTALTFGSYFRMHDNYIPSLSCSRTLDRFTVSSTKGNGKLTYPIGMITIDELMYAGQVISPTNDTNYLNASLPFWTFSPGFFSYNGAILESKNGEIYIQSSSPNHSNSLIPVISLKSTDIVESGDGTSTNPYVIKTN
jgi:hypothetical protein